jgi:copper(I)-binding protein
MLTPVRRRLAALAVVLMVPALGACGFGYQTDQVYQPGVGVNDRSAAVDVLGAVVVSGTDGSGTFVASLVNNDKDKAISLTSVTGAEGLEVQLVAPVEVEAGALVNLAEMGAIGVSGDSVVAGDFARITLTFDNGDEVEVNAPVVDRNGEFSGVRPAVPSSSATP